MASHAAAWNASQNLETDIGWLQGNGGTPEAFVRARQWRLLLLSPDLRARIRALPEYDFTLVSRPAGWFVQQRYVHPPHECIGTYCQWSLLPAFNSSSSVIVGARLRSLTALPSDGGLSLMLFGEGTRSQAFLTSDPTWALRVTSRRRCALTRPYYLLSATVAIALTRCLLVFHTNGVFALSEQNPTWLFERKRDLPAAEHLPQVGLCVVSALR